MWSSPIIVLVTLSAVLVFAKDPKFTYYVDKCPAKPAAGWPKQGDSCTSKDPAKDQCCRVIKKNTDSTEIPGVCQYGDCYPCSKLNEPCGGSSFQCCPVENKVDGTRCKTNAEGNRVCTKCIKTGQTCKGTKDAGEYECCESYWSCDPATKKCTKKTNVGKPTMG